MVAGFVFVKCELGKVDAVANNIAEVEGGSEVYSISGYLRSDGQSLR